jgi:DNA-directed RNA polymerase subunit RPC12/RpoP
LAFADKQDDDISRMFRSIGINKSTLTKGNSYFGGVEFEVDVTPGNPLCTTCGAPFRPRFHQRGLSLQCVSCGVEHLYCKPVDAPYHELVAAVAPEHRTGAKEVSVETSSQGTAIAVLCPQCGGTLDAKTLGEVISCPFCSTSVVVPARLMKQVSKKAIAKRAWWLAFAGKSPWRIEVEDELGRQALRQSRKRTEMELRRQREAERTIHDAEKQQKLFRIIMVILVLLVVAVIVAIFRF